MKLTHRPEPRGGGALPWISVAVVTYLLYGVVLGRVVAGWSGPGILIAIATGFIAIVWSSFFAAALSTVRPDAGGRLIGAVLSPRGLAVLAALAMLVAAIVVYDSRRPAIAEPFAGPYRDPAPYVMFTARAGYRTTVPQDPLVHGRATGSIGVNSLGFRGPEWPSAPEPGGLRVVVLGGSLVFLGHTDERTIPALIGAELSRRLPGTQVTVLNAGIVSANSTQELVLLQTRLIDLRPDIVIALDGFNDIWIPLLYEARPGYPYNFSVAEGAWRAYVESDNVLEALVSRSRLLQRVRSLFGGAASPYDRPQLAYDGDAAALAELPRRAGDLLLSNWTKMAQICDASGASCVFALQPTLLHRRTASSEGSSFRWPDRARTAVAEYYRYLEGRIGTGPDATPFGKAIAVSLAGLFERAAGQVYLNDDPVHVFDEGNVLISQRLADVVCAGAPRLAGRCR